MTRRTMTKEELRRVVAAEAAKQMPRDLTVFARSIRVSTETILRECADIWARRKLHQTAIYAPNNGKHAVYIHGKLLEAAGIRPGSHLSIRVVNIRRILITATQPECASLAIQRWGKAS